MSEAVKSCGQWQLFDEEPQYAVSQPRALWRRTEPPAVLPHRAPLVRAAGSGISNETAAHSLTLAPPPAGGGGSGGGVIKSPDVNATSSSLIRHDAIAERAASSPTWDAVEGRSLNGCREADWMTCLPVALDAEVYHERTFAAGP